MHTVSRPMSQPPLQCPARHPRSIRIRPRLSGALLAGTIIGMALPGFSETARSQDIPLTEIQKERKELGNSGPAVNETDIATVEQSQAPPPPSEGDKLDTSGNLLGDMWGLRPWLYKHGVTFNLQDVEELWGNTTGGAPSANDVGSGSGTGPSYDAVTAPTLTVDLEKLFGLKGGLFNVSALQTRGRSISQDHLYNYNPISGFEADRSTRLFELWYQQSFLNGKLDVKIGQQDLDTEFLISDYGSLYLNSNFGWPMAPSVNLYGGGPSWPLSSPAVRIRYRPTDTFTFMFAAADDNPPGNRYNSFGIQGGNSADPTNQVTNDGSGTRFNMGTGALLITELQYALNPQPDDMSKATKDPGLPGIYKLGGFYDTAKFPDYRYNRQGASLGAQGGYPRWDRGNWMVYGIIDQMLWRPSRTSPQSVGIFVRATGNSGDRNLISFAADAGINLKAPFRGRDNDTVGVGWGIGRSSSGWRQYNRDAGSIVPGNENHLEVTYQAQVTPWLVLQPDFQYVWHPQGGTSDPRYASGLKRVGNETIFGIHTNVNF